MTDTDIVVTEPAVISGMPEDVYHADPVPGGSLSSGGARTLLRPGGPARYAYERANPRTGSTKTFDIGHAVHTEALGVGAGIKVLDFRDYKTKAAQQAKADAYAAGQIPVLTSEYPRIKAMVDALRDHPIAGPTLEAQGDSEQSLFWVDQDTEMWCRARHDKAIRDRHGRLVVVDVKTCDKADDDSVAKSMATYGYHQQDQWYRRAAAALGLDDNPGFLFLFVEKPPPHLVNVVQLTPADVEVGRRRNDRALRIYADCVRHDRWPGYSDDITDITLPAWATREDA